MNLKGYLFFENQAGKFPRQIFEECGFDINILGIKRIESSGEWTIKKNRKVRKECEAKEVKLMVHEKFIIIKSIIERYKLKNKVNYHNYYRPQ